MEIGERIKKRREKLGMSQAELAEKVGYTSRSSIAKLETNANGMTQSKIIKFAEALRTTPSYLMGWEESLNTNNQFPIPNITEEYSTFPVIGEVAAGFDHAALESWEGETVDIPKSYLHGRNPADFFVLRVVGDSMYPLYNEGDKVLILRQTVVNASGDIGVVSYDGELATIKKIEYTQGEEWVRLVPINPIYKPETIEGCRLEQFRILGIPRLLIREINS